MVEKAPIVETANITGIPSDTECPWTLNLTYGWGDVFMSFADLTGKTGIYFQDIRFRHPNGSGPFTLIAEELSILPKAFMAHHGQIPPEGIHQNETEDLFPSYVDTQVQVGRNPNESKHIIKGIPDGDAVPDKFIDIEITSDGNAIVTMRDTRRNNSASIEFRTAENGGKYPIMAAVFTRIAERISKAKRQ